MTLILNVLGKNETFKFYFEDATLLDVLKEKYEVKTKKSLYTEYVVCVDNVCKEGDYSWLYYVNGRPMNLGVDVYKVRDGDVVELRYGEI